LHYRLVPDNKRAVAGAVLSQLQVMERAVCIMSLQNKKQVDALAPGRDPPQFLISLAKHPVDWLESAISMSLKQSFP
jgi:hypothetical protein